MFRDREKELERLSRQLLEEETEEYEEEEDEADEYEEDDYDEDEPVIYNTDTTDVDLEEYSEAVYEEPRRSWGLVAAVLLLTAAALLFLAYLLAKRGGLL